MAITKAPERQTESSSILESLRDPRMKSLMEFAVPGGGTGMLLNRGLMTAARLAKTSPWFRMAKQGGFRLEGGPMPRDLQQMFQTRVRRGMVPVLRGMEKTKVGAVPAGSGIKAATRFSPATQLGQRAAMLFQRIAEGRFKGQREFYETLRQLGRAAAAGN